MDANVVLDALHTLSNTMTVYIVFVTVGMIGLILWTIKLHKRLDAFYKVLTKEQRELLNANRRTQYAPTDISNKSNLEYDLTKETLTRRVYERRA